MITFSNISLQPHGILARSRTNSAFGALTLRDDALKRIDTPTGYFADGRMHYYVKDYQGNVRQVTDADGNVEQDNHYYPYGMLMAESSDILATARGGNVINPNPYLFGAKEYLTTAGANLLDFTARTYDPSLPLFQTQDPKAINFTWINPYTYCSGNPINKVDPDGCRELPVDEYYKNVKWRHENNYGDPRDNGRREHKGVDMNFGTGDFDSGAPVYSTIDGYVSDISSYTDNNGGGNRITIKSHNGVISTKYMHLSEFAPGLKVGMNVHEGQPIGNIGGSGNGSLNKYDAHLHYEILVNGVNIDPTNGPEHLKDPQKMIGEDNRNYIGSLDNIDVISKDLSKRKIILIDIPEIIPPSNL